MASVDGRRSCLVSSDEVIQHACGPCKDEGETKEAKYLCEICKVHLCFDCRNDHKQFKATKSHSIISANLTPGQGSSTTKKVFAILCSCNQKRAVELYCENHVEVICPTCETVKHWNCKTCPIKDSVTKDTERKMKELMNKAKSIKTEMENCKKDGEAYREKLESKTEECRKEITAFRREINMILDKMEKETVENLNTSANQQLQTIEKQIKAIATSEQALGTDLDIIESADKSNKEEVMFSVYAIISKSISEYENLVKDIRSDMRQPKLEFQKNKKLIDVLKSVEGLCSVEITRTQADSFQQENVVLLDMKVKSTKEVNIKLSDDDHDPFITGCTFLPNGRILLCDYNNIKLKLLDSDMSIKKSLKLTEAPHNVAAFGENEAIITFNSLNKKDLQYIYTHPDLKVGNTIALSKKCFGLQVINDGIYTACHNYSGHDEIWRLDRAGNTISKIVLTQASSGWSYYLGLCLASFCSHVYLSDGNSSRVTCFQLNGKMVYQFTETELKTPFGIYVDSAGNSLVCCYSSHNVVVITADGRKHGELLTSKDITYPRCIDYRPDDNTLIVGCANNSKMFFYKLGK